MEGNTVIDIQYVPISNHIPFNYNNPIDVLNYSHGDNVKALYNRISDDFFKEVVNPVLSVKQLHRYDTLTDDTHENTYEMGMKRLEYKRYKKQFEFFCPVWCNNLNDLNHIKFIINLANKNGRVMYSKVIQFSKEINNYIRKIYPSLGFDPSITTNEDLLYINFNEIQSHIKGLHVESGSLKTIDTSYVVNNLLYQERPVLETDNMLVELFAQNKTICTQLFNFSFVFNIEDFLPADMLKNLICEHINAYVDVYYDKTKCPVKDIYSNYEFIPKYDIYTGKYTNDDNVLDYMQDNKAIELINKNKLVQGTFHWVFQNNKNSIFNLYNGFAPINTNPNYVSGYAEDRFCTGISNDAPDVFTDEFNENKNPLGVFKYKDLTDTYSNVDFYNEIIDDDNYYSVDLSDLDSKEYQYFGNILLSNEKLKDYISQHVKIEDNNIITQKDDGTRHSDLENTYSIKKGNTNNLLYIKDIVCVKCAIFRYNKQFTYDKIRNLLPSSYLLSGIEYTDIQQGKIESSMTDLLAVRAVETSSNKYTLYITVLFENIDELIKKTISFNNLYDTDFLNDQVLMKDKLANPDYGGHPYYNAQNAREVVTSYIYENKQIIIRRPSRIPQRPGNIIQRPSIITIKTFKITQKTLCMNALNMIASIIKCTKFPNDIVFDKSVSNQFADSPSKDSTEVELLKIDKFVELQRYDSNILPMFIGLDEQVFKNYVYWCKQYNKTIQNTLNETQNKIKCDIDGIGVYSKYALKKFSPLYDSIGYYVLNSKPVDYYDYYLNEPNVTIDGIKCSYNYQKEKSWYKSNMMFYLPLEFTGDITKDSNADLTEKDIINIIYNKLKNVTEFSGNEYEANELNKNIIKYYIKDLYEYTITYDYTSETDISKQIYKLKFTLK